MAGKESRYEQEKMYPVQLVGSTPTIIVLTVLHVVIIISKRVVETTVQGIMKFVISHT